METQQKLSAGLGAAVLERLERIQPIPYEEGIVAGQAVSSAILELLGLPGGGAYNDIDIFVDNPSYNMDPTNEACMVTSKTYSIETTWYNDLAVIGHDDCIVVSSREEGKLNILETYFGARKEFAYFYPYHLIGGFDLNCVQAAVCLKTRQLYWTPAFEAFTRSRQLELTSLYTPVHSLLRLLKKRDELTDVYADVAKAVGIVKFVLSRSELARFSKGPELGAKAQMLFNRYAEELANHLVLDNSQATPVVRVAGEVDPRLEALVQGFCEYQVEAGMGSYLNRALMAAHIAYGSLPVALLERLKHFKACKDIDVIERLFREGPHYLQGNISLMDMRRVFKLLREHPRLPLDGLQRFTHCMAAHSVIGASIKRYGLWVVGSFETGEVPLIDRSGALPRLRSLEEMQPEFDEVQKDVHTPLRNRFLRSLQLNGVVVKELETRAQLVEEGAQMHHCVGGYASSVKAGQSRVFSLSSGPQPCDCSTLELRLDSSMAGVRVWTVAQHLSLANKEPSSLHRTLGQRVARMATHDEYPTRWEILKVELRTLYSRRIRPRLTRANYAYRDFRSGIQNVMEGRPFRDSGDIPF